MKLLSIIKKTNNNKPNYFDNLETLKHFPSSTREWNNSIFLYNENALPLIPHISKLAIKLIKSYFNIYNKKVESYIRTKRLLRRLRKLSSNRIFISNGEFKHTNNKVTITLYVYNKQKNNYLLKLKNRYLRKFFKKILSFKKINKTLDLKSKRLSNKIILIKKIKNIKTKGLKAILKANWYKYKIIKVLEKINKKKEIQKYISISKYVNNFYKKLVKRSLKRLEIYVFYKQLIYINKSKFNYTYLQYLKNHLQLLFNKNIEFNFINLKQFYLNSNILSESILLKITKNRKRLFKLLKNLKEKVKIRNKIKFINKPLISKLDLKKHFYKKTLLQKYIIKNLKYRHIIGFRLEAKGRLTRRYTASRSVHKLRYEGNLLNIDSSYNGIPSVLLKGNLRSNLQYTKLNSKTRIGSFGLKGWVNGN